MECWGCGSTAAHFAGTRSNTPFPMRPPTSGEVPVTARGRLTGISLRALLLGAVLVPVLCFWNAYSEIVAQSTELAGMSLSIGPVFALLVLLVVNGGLRRWRPGLALTQAELLFIYVMQTVSIGISSVGMLQFLHTGQANLLYFGSSRGWTARYQALLRSWAFPRPDHLRPFYSGESSCFTAEHLRDWVGTVAVWGGFVFVLLGVMLCLNVLFRRRWVEEERLTFPVTVLPLSLTRGGGANAFFASRLLWIGFLLSFVLDNMAAVGTFYPSFPFLPLKPSDPRLTLPFDESAPPWNALGTLQFSFYPTVIGLVYFLPLDVSFSCWFFFLLRKGEEVLAAAWGF